MTRFVRTRFVRLALAAGLVVAPAAAFAHAALKHAQPAAGSSGAAPSAITLDFSEGVVPRLSGISIRDSAGKPVKAGKATGSGASLSVAIDGKLAAGSYTVTWHAVSVDSHRTQGHFAFTVTP